MTLGGSNSIEGGSGKQTRTDAVAALSLAGLSVAAIAAELGASHDAVIQARVYARRTGRLPPRTPTRTVTAWPSTAVMGAMAAAARRRRLSVSGLTRRLLEVIVEGNLIDAVLDDAAQLAELERLLSPDGGT